MHRDALDKHVRHVPPIQWHIHLQAIPIELDPLGLALENFDAVGSWRTHDQGKLVDASGQLADGTTLDGVAGLRAALLQRPEVLVHTATEKLLTYALGRGLEPHDMPAVRAIVRAAKDDGYRFESLIAGVVSSAPFTQRSAEEVP